MNQVLTFSDSDFSFVIEHFKRVMRFYPNGAEIRDAFSKVTALVPDTKTVRLTRSLLADERPKFLRAICAKLSKFFEAQPTVPSIKNALEMFGYQPTIRICEEIRHLLLAENAGRWANIDVNRKARRIALCEGDDHMLAALRKLYDLDVTDTVSMLLRVFAMSAQAGKLDYLEVPYIAAGLSADDMKQYAQSLNFTIPKSPRKKRS